MKFKVLALIKNSPEKVMSWLLLVIFISLSSYLAISWLRKPSSFSSEEMVIGEERGESLTEATILVDFGGRLTRKPITYYADIAQRNPFFRLPEFIDPEVTKKGKIEEIENLLTKLNIVEEYREYYKKYLAKEYDGRTLPGMDLRELEKERGRLVNLYDNPDELEEILDKLKDLGQEEIEIREIKPRIGLICRGIISNPEGRRVALIEGKRTYWVKEGEEVEEWKVIGIEQNKVILYREEEKKELILHLGGR